MFIYLATQWMPLIVREKLIEWKLEGLQEIFEGKDNITTPYITPHVVIIYRTRVLTAWCLALVSSTS